MTLFLPVGPPACGKSQLAADLIDNGVIPVGSVVSPDTYRIILTGSKGDQSANTVAFELCFKIVEQRLNRGLDVYFDATNLKAADRRTLIAIAKSFRQRTQLITFLEEEKSDILQRNSLRGYERVPGDVMERMFQRWSMLPDPSEGWNDTIEAKDLRQVFELPATILWERGGN